MAKKRKIDLNFISIILTVIFFAISIIATYQMFSYQKNMDFLKLQNENLEKEKTKLESEIDPEWHTKFNNQKGYYESQLSIRDKEVLKLKNEKDSIEFFSNTFKKLSNGDYAIKREAVQKVALSFAINKQAEKIIEIDSIEIGYLKKIIFNQNEIIKNHELIVKNKEEQDKVYNERDKNGSKSSLISLITSLLGGLISLFVFRRIKKTP